MSRSFTRLVLPALVLSLGLSACSGDDSQAPTPQPSITSTSSAAPDSATSPSSSPAATPSATATASPSTTTPPVVLDPAQVGLEALRAVDWNAQPVYDLGSPDGVYVSLNDLRARGAQVQLLGVSFNIVNGSPRALIIHTDARGDDAAEAVMQLFTFTDGAPQQVAVGTLGDYVPADLDDNAFLTHAAFEESTEGVVVYANFQRAGAQTPYTRMRVRIAEGGPAGVKTGWLQIVLNRQTVSEGVALGATELPPGQNVVTYSPYADDPAQPLPPL